MASLGERPCVMKGQITTKTEEQELREQSLMVFMNHHSGSAGSINSCYTVDGNRYWKATQLTRKHSFSDTFNTKQGGKRRSRMSTWP